MKLKNSYKLIVSIIVCQLAGVIGSIFTTPKISTWYSGLVRPALNPPSWVFGPVWTTLFVLMGISAYLVWKEGVKERAVRVALWIFLAQLVLNVLWSVLFFGLQSPMAAFIEIVVLWLMILISIIYFSRISRLAAWLLVPYILWVSFASYLNLMYWLLN